MRLRSFHGRTQSEALQRVREALGENAIIVSTYDEEGGGVRVTAAIEDKEQDSGRVFARPCKFDEDHGSTVIETIADALVRHQAGPALSERILAAATRYAGDDAVITLAAALDSHFKFRHIDEDETSKPLIFLGPPGAGKTLLVAKLATASVMAKRPVAVLSADTERAGGIDQLAAFTRLLKIELMQIDDAPSLRDAVRMQKADTLILVDTPGRNPFAGEELASLRELAEVCGEAVLVLPSDMDSSEAVDMAYEFRKAGAARFLPTRLDMTRRLGGILRTAYEARLPFANFSASHKVTETPRPLNPVELAGRILAKQGEKVRHTELKRGTGT